MARSKSSKKWLAEHFDDPYVQRAQREGLRSRAAFKLQELQERYQLVKPGMTVVDLGAAPGGWLQLVIRWLRGDGVAVGLDVLPIEPMEGALLIQGDFTEDEPLAALTDALDGQPVDLVLSDMAPNISGMRAVDQPRAMYLVELAQDFARQHLRKGGTLLMKVFQGEGFDELVRQLRVDFSTVSVVKPKASRPRSREVYVLARGAR